MKYLLVIITILSVRILLSAQMSLDFEYNSEFESCKGDYNELERVFIPKQGYSSKYFINKEPYTGCAKYEHKSRNGLPAEYMVTHILDGYATKMTYYYQDGSISREFNYRNGRAHGLHIMYYQTGDIYIEEHYEDGRPHGSQKRWLENGDVGRIGLYENGMPIYDTVYFADTNC